MALHLHFSLAPRISHSPSCHLPTFFSLQIKSSTPYLLPTWITGFLSVTLEVPILESIKQEEYVDLLYL